MLRHAFLDKITERFAVRKGIRLSKKVGPEKEEDSEAGVEECKEQKEK
jgi:aromatic ring-cleaving dioxygenase